MRNKDILDIRSKIRDWERDIQKQLIKGRIRESRYNKRYKEIGKDRPNYLLTENLNRIRKGDKVRALIRTRCGNLKEGNKY